MNKRSTTLRTTAIISIILLYGCVSQPPTISHTHIGHAMTGWADTPAKKGLFVTAENSAHDALQAALSATNKSTSLLKIKKNVTRVINATKFDIESNTEKRYGVYYALNSAINHITFAETSPDASENIKNSTKSFNIHAQVILDRCDFIVALSEEILETPSLEEAKILSDQLLKSTVANINGEDIDGDGVTGTIPDEYGLKQLRSQLQAMIDREIPPYRTVKTWYLFNLIRLPNGDWSFRPSPNGASSTPNY